MSTTDALSLRPSQQVILKPNVQASSAGLHWLAPLTGCHLQSAGCQAHSPRQLSTGRNRRSRWDYDSPTHGQAASRHSAVMSSTNEPALGAGEHRRTALSNALLLANPHFTARGFGALDRPPSVRRTGGGSKCGSNVLKCAHCMPVVDVAGGELARLRGQVEDQHKSSSLHVGGIVVPHRPGGWW